MEFTNKSEYPRSRSTSPKTIVLAATIAVLFWSFSSKADPLHKGDYLFWSQMPQPWRVLADEKGTNDFDRAARQRAGLELLKTLAGVDGDRTGQIPWPPRVSQRYNAYIRALPDVDGQHNALLTATDRLMEDPSFVQSFLKRYFSAAALSEINSVGVFTTGQAQAVNVQGTAKAASAHPSHKGEYLFWSEMPEASQVLKDMKGKNDLDTAARQHAGLMLLMALVKVDMNGKGLHNYTASENKLIYEYFAVLPESDGHGHVAEMRAESLRLQADPSFVRLFLSRYFSEAALREIEPVVFSFEASAQKEVQGANAQRKKDEEGYVQTKTVESNEFRQISAANAQSQSGLTIAEIESGAKTFEHIYYTLCSIFSALWLVRIIRLFRPFRTTSDDPPRFEGQWKDLTINTFTGYVRGSATRSHTSVTGSIRPVGNTVQGGISSTTTVTDTFRLVNPRNQQEQNFQLRNWDVQLWDDQLVSVAWAIRKHRKEGPYFIVLNHTTCEHLIKKDIVRQFAKRSSLLWTLTAITCILFPIFWLLAIVWAVAIKIKVSRFMSSGIQPLLEFLNQKAKEFS
jgi:hypothetical protein